MNRLYSILLFIVLFTPFFGLSQQFAFDRITQIKGSNWNFASDVKITEDKSLLMLGNYKDKLFINNDSIVAKGDRDIFLVKFDSLGNIIWWKNFGGNNYDYAGTFAIDTYSNIFITGSFLNKIYFDTDSLVGQNYIDNFIIKLDEDGNYLSGIVIPTLSKEFEQFLIPNNDGSIMYCGTFRDYFNIGDSLSNYKNSQIFITQFSNDLNLLQLKTISSYGDVILSSICKKNNNFYFAVNFTDSLNLDENLYYSYGEKDICYIKSDTNFNIIWTKHIAGFGNDEIKKIVIDENENTFLLGESNNKLFFSLEDTLNSIGGKDIFVAKYNENGQKLWSKIFGAATNDYAESIVLKNNYLYVSGSFRDTIYLENKKTRSKDMLCDLFISKFDVSGNSLWINSLGGNNPDLNGNLIIDKDNYLYFTGSFGKDFSFGTDSLIVEKIVNAEENEVFIAKFFDCDNADELFSLSDTFFCNSATLKANNGFRKYLWNDYKRGQNFTVYNSNFYYVSAIDKHKCLVTSDSVYITILQKPQVDLGSDIYVLPNQIITLDAGEFETYLWSNGDTTQQITILTDLLENPITNFSVIVSNQYDCQAEANISVILEQAVYGTYNQTSNNLLNSNNTINDFANNTETNNSAVTNIVNIENIKETSNEEIIKLGFDPEAIVYPNPSNDVFFINLQIFENYNNIEVQIINSVGCIVSNQKYNNTQTIKENLQQKGVYYIVIKLNNNKQIIKKLIIK